MSRKHNAEELRKEAIRWWANMTFEEQFYRTIEWLKSQNKNTAERHPSSLTGREIEEIYNLKNNQI